MVERRLPRWSEFRELARPRPIAGNATDRRLAGAATVADLREIARRRAPRAVFDYTDGAAGAEISLRRAREAFQRIEFCPSVLRDVSAVDPSTRLLGMPSALPLAFAPTGFTRLMHTEGEIAVGRVAERTGIPYALSTMGTTSLEALATAASPSVCMSRVNPVGAKASGRAAAAPSTVVDGSTAETSRSTRGRNSTASNAARDRRRLSSDPAAPSV